MDFWYLQAFDSQVSFMVDLKSFSDLRMTCRAVTARLCQTPHAHTRLGLKHNQEVITAVEPNHDGEAFQQKRTHINRDSLLSYRCLPWVRSVQPSQNKKRSRWFCATLIKCEEMMPQALDPPDPSHFFVIWCEPWVTRATLCSCQWMSACSIMLHANNVWLVRMPPVPLILKCLTLQQHDSENGLFPVGEAHQFE